MARIKYKLVAYYQGLSEPQVSYFPTRDELLVATAEAKEAGAIKIESGPA